MSARRCVASTLALFCVAGTLGADAHPSDSGGGAIVTATELASLASSGDAVQLWQRATASAAAAVVEALEKQDASKTVELRGADLGELRIWHGQSVSLGLEADGQVYRYVVSSEEDWRSLEQVLPAAQGGLLPRHDWDSIERDWLSPVSRGSLLPDFALEGPVDVFLTRPTALQLFLPHASDAGTVQRVLLREGAAVMVRGARSVRLRRGLDLPPIGLSEFAGIVAADAGQRQPLGVLHLLAGVRAAAAAHWNASHPDQSLGLVGLELDLSPHGAALLAAPAATTTTGGGGSGQRLRVRPVKPGVIELVARDAPPQGGEAARGAVAVPSAVPPSPTWPLASVHPMQLQSYERLLRQVISSRLFRAPKGQQQAFRVAQDVSLRLLETEAQATTLLQLRLELERRPRKKAAGAAAGAAAAPAGRRRQQQQEQQQAVAVAVADDEPPDAHQVLAAAAGRLGPHETWRATVQVRGDAQRGTLRFVPLHLERVGASHDTVKFAQEALNSLYGMNRSEVVAQ